MYIDKNILRGKECPYCGRRTKYVDSSEIYGRSYGMIYLCRSCDAYVGVHQNSNVAKGRLANAELRSWKKKAHFLFDDLWKRKIIKERCAKSRARTAAYQWLSKQLGIDPKYCHIGFFDLEQCKNVVKVCRPFNRYGYTN